MNYSSAVPQSNAANGGWPHGLYLVGLDGSQGAVEALRHAVTLAQIVGAQLEAVVAWDWTSTDWSPEQAARQLLHDAVERIGILNPPTINLVVRHGNPAEVLIALSSHADLLILGSRGHGGFAGMLLGSVSSVCAEHASCPVLIIHDRTDRLPSGTRVGLDV